MTALKTEEKVKQGLEAKKAVDIGALQPLAEREERMDKQMADMQAKMDALKEQKDNAIKEKTEIQAELKKVPPIVTKGLEDLANYDKQIKELTTKRADQASGLKEEMTKLKVKESFINTLLGTRGFAAGKKGGGKRISADEKQGKIVDAINAGNNNLTKIQAEVGMSANTRENIKALVDSGKITVSETGIYAVA
jgi:chromosome segregation ATPase